MTSTETSFPPLELSPDTPDCLNVAELIVAYLERLEVDYVFGVPGGAIEPLYNALAASACRGGPRPVVARHETGAA
ncbi:MAG TPA: thiamine pyrophosphate-binding protein, partial [Noviherbaspirillum sp.]|nr:thiamine pyrophosphate-binding protein [Noviherbaspirillum sp.]